MGKNFLCEQTAKVEVVMKLFANRPSRRPQRPRPLGSLDGPSRTIIVEPLEAPAPAPPPETEPGREPERPARREPPREPARSDG